MRVTKSDAIRAALKGRALTLRQLQPVVERRLKQIIGKAELYKLLSVMQNAGELESAGRGDWRFYCLSKQEAA